MNTEVTKEIVSTLKENKLKRVYLRDLEGLGMSGDQSRYEYKYIVPTDMLLEKISNIASYFNVLEVKGKLIETYNNRYLDTESFSNYYDHVNGKRKRKKIRVRSYLMTGDKYLEVKTKEKPGRTDKVRYLLSDGYKLAGSDSWTKETKFETNIDSFAGIMTCLESQFLDFKDLSLNYSLFDSYQRITLVNAFRNERLTIDLDLTFSHPDSLGRQCKLEHIAILELKQYGKCKHNKLAKRVLKNHGFKSQSISKYCLGMAIIRDGEVKTNLMKPLIRKIVVR